MITAWIGAGGVLLSILAILVRISFQLGSLMQRFSDHVLSADKIHGDQEGRIRALERPLRGDRRR